MHAATLPIGTELGGYVLAGVLGSGASGTVYRAKDAEGLPVALKLLHPGVAADPAARRRLEREVQAQRAIRSPFVARVVDVELDGADVFIVTELVEGLSLARDIVKNGPWPPADLGILARDLDRALAAVHAAGVVHRDVKPSNVVLRPRGRPVLIDFGIAQSPSSDRLTGAGLVAGTPGFVSPELLRGGDPTAESDTWAAAALLLNAATGRQPFGTGPVEAVLTRVLDSAPDLDGLPEHLAGAFGAALGEGAARRLTLAELADALAPPPLDEPFDPADGSAHEHLPPTRIAPRLPGEQPDGATEQLWTEPPVVDYRRWAARPSRDVPTYPPEGDLPDAVPPPPSPDPPVPRGTPGVLLGLWALLAAWGLHAPWVAAAVGAAAMAAGRTVWAAAEALAARRRRRGQSAWDGARVAVGLPWYLVRGVAGTLPGLACGVAAGLGGYLVATRLADLPGVAAAEAGAAAVAVGLALAWWGPSGVQTRLGGRTAIRWLARTAAARALLALAALGGAAAILASWPW